MTAKRRHYQTYPRAFKLEALKLLEESDQPASEIARQLGIRQNRNRGQIIVLAYII